MKNTPPARRKAIARIAMLAIVANDATELSVSFRISGHVSKIDLEIFKSEEPYTRSFSESIYYDGFLFEKKDPFEDTMARWEAKLMELILPEVEEVRL